MTSLDFQSLLKQEKALRRAAPTKKELDSLEAAPEVAASHEDDRTEQSPWFVELAERPLLEMDKARFQCLLGSPKFSQRFAPPMCAQQKPALFSVEETVQRTALEKNTGSVAASHCCVSACRSCSGPKRNPCW